MLLRLPLPSHFFFPRFGPATGRHFFGNDELPVWKLADFFVLPKNLLFDMFSFENVCWNQTLTTFLVSKWWQRLPGKNYPPVNKHSNEKISILNRKYIFKWWIFHCYVRLPEGIPWSLHDLSICGPSLSPPAAAGASAWTWNHAGSDRFTESLLVLDFTDF